MADVELQLIDSKRNCFRVYAISEALSLFGELCLVISWGRIGRVRTPAPRSSTRPPPAMSAAQSCSSDGASMATASLPFLEGS